MQMLLTLTTCNPHLYLTLEIKNYVRFIEIMFIKVKSWIKHWKALPND